MTVPAAQAAPTVPFGQALGEAHRHAQAAHLRLLASMGSSFLEWVVLNLVSAGGGPAALADLTRDLAEELSIEQSAVRQVIDAQAAAGRLDIDQVDGNEYGRLSPAGRDYFQRIREAVGQATAELLAPFDPTEVATAVRVLVAVKERAPAIQAG